MRFVGFLAVLLLLQAVDATERAVISEENESFVSPDVASNVNKTAHDRWKRQTSPNNRRGLRTVSFFEMSGDNFSDNEFVSKSTRDNDPREEEPIDSNRNARLEINGRNYRGCDNTKLNRKDNPQKFQLFDKEPENSGYRTERQVKPYDLPASRFERNKSLMDILRWNKNGNQDDSFSQSRYQKNDAYPVNDDLADFSGYVYKSDKKFPWNNLNKIEGDSHYERNYTRPAENLDCLAFESNETPSDYSLKHRFDSYGDFNTSGETRIKYDQDPRSVESSFSGAAESWDEDKVHNPSAKYLTGSSSNEEESELQDSEYRKENSDGVVGGHIIREKPIRLPEPLIFNSSHVVSSFVYTMIPFRSPLLNLLENDKHSKYIMIKIDPVLQPTKKRLPYLHRHDTESVLESNLIKVIDKLIASDDRGSIETLTRLKQNKIFSPRYSRRVAEIANPTTLSPNDQSKRRLSDAIS